MSTLSFPIEYVNHISTAKLITGANRMQVSVTVSQEHKREILRQLGASVSGETLAQWLKEDFAWDVTDMEVTE